MKTKALIIASGFALLLPAYLLFQFGDEAEKVAAQEVAKIQHGVQVAKDKLTKGKTTKSKTKAKDASEGAFNLAIAEWKNNSGSKVLWLQRDELPILDISLSFAAGSAQDQIPGTAAMTSKLIKAGTKKLNADALSAAFEDLGAQFSRSAARDMATIELRTLSAADTKDRAIDLLLQVIHGPAMPVADFNREQARALMSLVQDQEDPGTIASREFYSTLYQGHPYAHPVIGTEDSLKKLSPKLLRKFYKENYTAQNAVITIVGAVDKAEAETLANAIGKALPQGKAKEFADDIDYELNPGLKKIKFASAQTHIIAGLPFMKWDDPDYFPLYVGNHILGKLPLTSRIFSEVRVKRGLAYDAHSYFVPMKLKGPYVFGLQTQNAQAEEALAVLKQTIGDFIKQGPTDEELKNAKQNLLGSFPLRYATNDSIGGMLSVIGFYNLPLDYLNHFMSNIEAVTAEQVHDAFQRRLKLDDLSIIAVGNIPGATD